jgi:hypothetical protein
VSLHILVPAVRAVVGRRAAAATVAKLIVGHVALIVQAHIVQPLLHAVPVIDGMAQAFLLTTRP